MKAFRENELNREINFNIEGVTEVEKKLRLILLKLRLSAEKVIELIMKVSAFLGYFLQCQYCGKLEKSADYAPWAWHMQFESYNFFTYPITRLWKCPIREYIPQPGWLFCYVNYIDTAIKNANKPKYLGVELLNLRIKSHPERIIDTETGHEKILILGSTLKEIKDIQFAKPGVVVIKQVIQTRFKPETMSPDDWKFLRCYAHILWKFSKWNLRQFGIILTAAIESGQCICGGHVHISYRQGLQICF